MSEEKNQREGEKSFVVKDKRFSAQKEAKDESQPKDEKKVMDSPGGEASKESPPLPEITFSTLLFSLSTSALIQLGEIQDPHTNQPAKNLPLAKQTIDLIGMLKEKTKGNLTSEEDKFMDNILYDLKMRYVKAVA